MRDLRDLRDPAILGEALLETAEYDDPLHIVYDHFRHSFEACPDYIDPPVIDRYGDPVASHRARIAAGLEVELP